MEFIQELPKDIKLVDLLHNTNSVNFFKKQILFADFLEVDIYQNFDKSGKISQELGIFYENPIYSGDYNLLSHYDKRFMIGIPFLHLPPDSQERIDAENIYIESGMFDRHDNIILDIFSQRLNKKVSFAENFYNFFFKDIAEPAFF